MPGERYEAHPVEIKRQYSVNRLDDPTAEEDGQLQELSKQIKILEDKLKELQSKNDEKTKEEEKTWKTKYKN